jgi:DNA-binding NtrC family response regulator
MEQINDPRTPILVVDDDSGLLASIHAVLVGAGFLEPALLSDGRRVMELLRTLDIHLVLLDLIMPQVEGLELLRRIQDRTLEELEKRHIRDVLGACDGNRAEAARILGVNPSAIYRKTISYAI